MQQNTFLKHVLQRTTLSSGKCHLHCLFSMVINGPNATKTLFKIRTAKTLSYIYQVIHHDTCQGVTFERWWLNQPNWKICWSNQIGQFLQTGVKITYIFETTTWCWCFKTPRLSPPKGFICDHPGLFLNNGFQAHPRSSSPSSFCKSTSVVVSMGAKRSSFDQSMTSFMIHTRMSMEVIVTIVIVSWFISPT